MAKQSSAKQESKTSSIPFDRFKAVVMAMAELRDTGKLLVFLGSSYAVRIIGVGARSEQLVTEKLAEKSYGTNFAEEFGEIRSIFKFMSRTANTAATVSAMIDSYSHKFGTNDPEKASLIADLHKRVECVFNILFIDSLRQRARRIKTATVPILEDTDFEIVTERVVDDESECVLDPFLRFKVRYFEKRNGSDFPWFLFGENKEKESFELECDESDLDFLILRLTEAKNRLIQFRAETSECEN